MNRARGFTLLELLVAVGLFAVLAGLAWGSLDGLSRGSVQMQEAATRLADTQRALDLVVRDLRQAVPRPVRDGSGRAQAALSGERLGLEFTRGGHGNALALPRATLERVGWRQHEGRLQRLHWPVLDRAAGTQPRVDMVLDRVQALELRYRDASGREQAQWPPPRSGDAAALPRAVELRLRLEDMGEIVRLVELPGTPR